VEYDTDSETMKKTTYNYTGRSLIELITVWTAILIIIGFLVSHFNIILVRAKEQALRSELKNLRLAVSLYHILNKSYPDTLEELIDKAYSINPRRGAVLKSEFLRNLKYDSQGRLKDPFENIYLYNSRTGMIESSSKGYEDW
jgi:hypothetical protein